MRIAAIYDLHGNLPALEAVLEDVRRAQVNLLIVGGDILPGPMPRETLECLLSSGIPTHFIQGNGEVDALAEMSGAGAVRVPEQFRGIVRWSAHQLYPDYQSLLASWPKTVRIETGEFDEVLFCHATPRDDNEIFTSLTPEERLLPIFEKLGVSLVVCGHTHMQFDRMIGDVRVVNAGSVGMPFGDPGADWLLLDSEIQFRHTPYDATKAAERIQQTDYPEAEEFVTNYVLNTPNTETMLAAYSCAELNP